MPLTVTAWPTFLETRGPSFSLVGYAFGQVPPPKYIAKTTGALAPYESLNAGVLLVATSFGPNNITYQDVQGTYILSKAGFQVLQTVPQDHSVFWVFTADETPGDPQSGNLFEVFPAAIANRVITTSPLPSKPDLIPNDVTFAPANFLVLP